MKMVIPEHLSLTQRNKAAILKGFPDTGQAWIDGFETLIAGLLSQWSLTIVGKASGGWPTNVVYFVQDHQGRDLVLKLGHPSPESVTESIVLSSSKDTRAGWIGFIEYDSKANALLLERADPGYPLRHVITDDSAVLSALVLHIQVPRAVEEADLNLLPTYCSWLQKAFKEYRSAQPDSRTPDAMREHIANAEGIFTEIASDQDYVLHGDLHHENILKADNAWLAIDPKGVIGPKRLECGRFLHNFLADEIEGVPDVGSYQAILERRFRLAVAVLPYNRRELIDVTYLDLTLATTWHINSSNNADAAMQMLQALQRIWVASQ